ncbi:HEPN domain-containing protein [Chitinophaga sp.]|uniref:HEPN domain-containing protein n=1 Tax=Chitinophaga sp. TaxID=1869181 RepID=UPI0031DCE9D3
MPSPFTQFETNIKAIRDLKNTLDHLDKITTNVVDVSDLYRSLIVLNVSALDHFVHEIILHEMIEIYKGNRPPTAAFLRFQIPLSNIHGSVIKPSEIAIRDSIRNKHSWLSFQDPDKIAEAIRLISEKKIWEEIGRVWGVAGGEIKIRLKLIIDRRNKIAHEADMDPTFPGQKWSISPNDVSECTEFIHKLVSEICNVIT